MPAAPAAAGMTNPGPMAGGASRVVNPAMSAAPATPPSVPSAVIPPDVPRVTRLPEVMRRGGEGEIAPVSVAPGLAAAAAVAPAAPAPQPANAATQATPPVASHLRAVA